jgi:hypothetical protein
MLPLHMLQGSHPCPLWWLSDWPTCWGHGRFCVMCGYKTPLNITNDVNAQMTTCFAPATSLQVYLPMSYIYGIRGTCKVTPLTAAIRCAAPFHTQYCT